MPEDTPALHTDTHSDTQTASGAEAVLPEETHASEEHGHSLAAEPIFQIGSFEVTNALFTSWIVVVCILIIGIAVKTSVRKIPGKLQGFFELLFEAALGIVDSVTNDKAKSATFFPLVFALFLFILLNNWIGLIPGVGSVGYIASVDGHDTFISFLRGGSADLNTTLALAIIGVVASHIFGVIAVGAWKHFNKFINIEAIASIPSQVRTDPTVLIVNPIKVFVSLVEIIGELAKVASLSFRLFGNIFAGEVLLASMSAILAWGLPLPFLFLEVLVGLIQASIFAILVLTYLTIHTSAEEH
jgi:F-type H+-transporting ATPase subunit a